MNCKMSCECEVCKAGRARIVELEAELAEAKKERDQYKEQWRNAEDANMELLDSMQ